MKLLAQNFFGTINQPAALQPYGAGGGLIVFMSNVIRLIVVIGGLVALFNIISAGFQYITSQGDPKATEKTMSTLTSSLLGLVLMIAAPAIAAIVGYVLFGNPAFILKPTLTSPTSTSFLLEVLRYV